MKLIELLDKFPDKWIAVLLFTEGLAIYGYMIYVHGSTTFIEGVVLTLLGFVGGLLIGRKNNNNAPVGPVAGDVNINPVEENKPKENI